ncbi:MAG: MoaF-related domain-containing protein [Pseudonocardiaceae bacterium]
MKGEQYPAPGNSYEANFGEFAWRLDFDADGKTVTFSPIDAKQEDLAGEPGSQTVTYTAVPIRDGIFMVYWQEARGTTVTHVQDFESQRVHTNITTRDDTFINLPGTFTPVNRAMAKG